MARLARVVVPGLSYHVTHRGNRRADIFVDDNDRVLYVGLMRDYAAKAGLGVRAWCLMSNHVHFVVVPEREGSLARGIGLAHRRFAAWQNARHGWLGHLWANRYFSTPLDETHLWRAVRYVERNPVRAGLVGSRPCGDVGFLAGLERILNRVLAPRKAGRRPRNPDQRTHNAGGEGDGFQ